MSTLRHLDHWKLPENAQKSLRRLDDAMTAASKFDNLGSGIELCKDTSVDAILSEVLVVLKIDELVGSSYGTSLWRISGPEARILHNSPGPAYLYPMRVHDGKLPAISNKPVDIGSAMCILERVTITPGLNCLVVSTL
ncbi:hypothetical protein V496_01037 [Pseudogymnoascus sp. VKM F-4515 (FW-2607)]|nr:hypothetical protein V496_01037 [Pseudogymnoascus sp. VKM F-4515 (FW-2607)]